MRVICKFAPLQTPQHMMAQSTLFSVLVAALLFSTLSYCSAENVYCVTPTATSCSSCPHNTHCATLSEYAQEAELYFTSNTTMVFLPGDHTLDTNITVGNVARLTMRGESSSGNRATVACSGPVGLSFTNMVEFKVHSLLFTFCGRDSVVSPVSKYALLLESIAHTELFSCSFHGNLGTALVVDKTNITMAGNNDFTHNHCPTCMGGGGIVAINAVLSFNGINNFVNNSAGQGGAIYTSYNTVLSFNGTNNFTNNSADYGGGAIYASDKTVLSFYGANNFIKNLAGDGHGGAIYASDNTVLNFSGTNSTFISNSAYLDGGAIYTSDNTVLSFDGVTNFINNLAHNDGGGAISTSENTVLNFNGASNFINNVAVHDGGGAIYASENTVLNFIGINNFSNNSAGYGGGIYTSDNTTLSFNGANNFINNLAMYGSAIYTSDNTVFNFNETSNFISNSAQDGGAIYTSVNTTFHFTGTSNFISNSAVRGGAMYMSDNTVLSFNGTSNFINNIAHSHVGGTGGAIYMNNNAVVSFIGANNFTDNSAGYGGAIYTSYNTVLSFNGINNFINNSACFYANGAGGAIYANNNTGVSFTGSNNFTKNLADAAGGAIYIVGNASLWFNRSSNFIDNSANDGGGAIYLSNSTFFILSNTSVLWENNHAKLGGAIYVNDQSNPFIYCTQANICTRKEKCFFQLPGQNMFNGINVQLVFKNNSADDAGSVLYGGAIDNCTLIDLDSYSSGEVFDMLVHIDDDNTNPNISSLPFLIRQCKNNIPEYNEPSIVRKVYPGETFYASVGAFGQRKGAVPSGVRCYITRGNLQGFQYIQQTNNACTTFNYTVFSLSPTYPEKNVHIVLYADGPCSTFSDKLVFHLNIHQNCPPGFNISESARACVCEQRLQRYTYNCNITNGIGKITRYSNQQFWVGYDDQSHELILQPHCPLDYCVSQSVSFSLNDTDKQCAYNRSSLLCGACKEGYSLVLGTSRCMQCTNSHLVLLIPFAVMGIALVFFLFVCKLTVATGTLSGLVFYANIVTVNRTIFLPVESTNALSVFIAWLNLDFGIETCFYNGMDTYTKTWLQFVFPVYIWLLVGLMILLSHFSHRFAKLLGNNPASVLATLILLSYAKILRTLITAFYITYLEYPTYNKRVWLYDGNVNYLEGKHIPLFIVAVLVFLFLFFPYTLLLLFGQWLQAISHPRLLSWVNSARLKPFMDSYHAPYKAKHRYWPGLLLMLRFVLLFVFVFEFNSQGETNINLLAILVGTGAVQMWAWVSGGIYKNWCLDALEGSFALNLIILAAATSYVSGSQGSQLAVGYTSVSIAFATFIGILGFQLANVTGIAQYLKRKCTAMKTTMIKLRDGETETESDTDSLPDRLINPGEYEPVLQITQENTAAAAPTGTSDEQRNRISVYTYSSLN